MPVTTTRDDQRRRLTVVASGVVTLQELLALQDQRVADGAWTYAMCYDGSGRESILTSAEVRRLGDHMAGLASRHGPAGPLAIVRPDDAGFGVARMFEAFNDARRVVAVFRDPAQAATWLDEQQARGGP